MTDIKRAASANLYAKYVRGLKPYVDKRDALTLENIEKAAIFLDECQNSFSAQEWPKQGSICQLSAAQLVWLKDAILSPGPGKALKIVIIGEIVSIEHAWMGSSLPPSDAEVSEQTSALKSLIAACEKYFNVNLSSLGASYRSSLDITREVREGVHSAIAAAKRTLP